MTATVRLTTGADPLFAGAAELFDDHRRHYGANPARQAVETWLRDLLITDRIRLYVAGPGDSVDGFCSVAVVPAALTLRTLWLVRDLYVRAEARRRGVAAALLGEVAGAARAEGAHRLSLQTESDNERALHLYARAGFEPVTQVTLLHRML